MAVGVGVEVPSGVERIGEGQQGSPVWVSVGVIVGRAVIVGSEVGIPVATSVSVTVGISVAVALGNHPTIVGVGA